jgi:hypothetical protein
VSSVGRNPDRFSMRRLRQWPDRVMNWERFGALFVIPWLLHGEIYDAHIHTFLKKMDLWMSYSIKKSEATMRIKSTTDGNPTTECEIDDTH